MSNDKFCVNCKYYAEDDDLPYHTCHAAHPSRLSLITGKHNKVQYTHCTTMRGITGLCKPEGLLYDPKLQKLTLWQHLNKFLEELK
jgi:hypothetical protein